jgi:Ion channel
MKRPLSIFFGRDKGMAFFLAFLVLTTILVPMMAVSQLGRLALSFVFVLTLISGAFATIQPRILRYLVVVLAVSTLATDLIAEFTSSQGSSALETTLRLACLSILVFMTLKRTLRPGPVTLYRVMGGIAGYLLIGFTWTFAYQLVEHQVPGAFHFASGVADVSSRQPSHLIYFSFVTLTTVGYGDVYPVHPAVRSLAVAEALVGQLYLAILIASLVGVALQAKLAGVLDSGVNSDTSANKSQRYESLVGRDDVPGAELWPERA